MADFKALDAFLDDYLELPVQGSDGTTRVYRIEDPSAEDGIRVERIMSLSAQIAAGGEVSQDTKILDDKQEMDLYRMCLGAAYEPLKAEVSWGRFKHAALTAMFWITTDLETAQKFWTTGQTGNREARRQAKRASSASAAASTTRSRASTSGTKAATKPRKKAAAKVK
ncbi:hypothetical protein [Streptomyces sp. NPDC060194]|uniref:DUF7426 family protein n=1 Tax=Streptomyces sp. NPDC060194 TaxID=3347069 RepID=UPI00364634F9